MGKDALFKHSQRKRERQVESTNKLVSEMNNRFLIENKDKIKAANIEAAGEKTDVHNSKKLQEQKLIMWSNYENSMKKANQKLSELEKHLDNVYKDMTALKTCESFPETRTESFKNHFKTLCDGLQKMEQGILRKRKTIQALQTPITKVTEGLQIPSVFTNPFRVPSI